MTRLCNDCWDIKTPDHQCASNESRQIKNHCLKAVQFPKLDKESDDPYQHRLLILKKLVKDYEILGFDKKKNKKTEKEASDTPARREKKEKNPGPGRKKIPLTGYMKFSNAMRSEIRERHPDARMTEVSKLIAAQWRELSDEQKESYKVR